MQLIEQTWLGFMVRSLLWHVVLAICKNMKYSTLDTLLLTLNTPLDFKDKMKDVIWPSGNEVTVLNPMLEGKINKIIFKNINLKTK